jgi:hypothetical protein
MDEIHRALGQFICAQNPYTNLSGEEGPPQKPQTEEMLLAPDWQKLHTAIENGDYALLWEFGGKQHRVRRAVRIAYTYKAVYTLPNGDTKERDVTEHLLIGYEGSGGE